MRPTFTEQLSGVARILTEVIGPHVDDDNAREQLGHCVNVVLGVANGWVTYVARVVADGVDLASVLGAAGVSADDLPGPPEDLTDVAAVDAWHGALRSRLEDEIRARAAAGAASDDLRAHLLRHTTRFA